MDPERWRRVQELLVSTLAREPAGRAGYLERQCGDDDELRLQVERLAEVHPRARGFLERPPWRQLEEALAARDAAGTAASLEPGARIGRYVVRSRLGEGGMGAVYAARDPELEREVAVKLIPPGRGLVAARLLREAQALARVSHPHVVTVHDAGTHGDGVFLAMELMPRGTLEEWLEAAPRTRRQVLDAFLQAGRGLAAAHEAGVVHRDFKPGNVLRAADGTVRVADFGLARTEERVEAAGTGNGTPAGSAGADVARAGARRSTAAAMGTPWYLAPERYRDADAGPASDQFAFCVALWEALCGEHPFTAGSTAELRERVLAGEVRNPPPGAAVPRRLQTVLRRGLAADPDRRWGSMGELLGALERARAAPGRRLGAAAVPTALALALLGAWAAGRDQSTLESARSIAGRPGVAAGPAETRAARSTGDLEAYGFYLKGREQLSRRNGEGLRKAAALFERSLETDPANALAYSGLADAYALMVSYRDDAVPDALERARAAARRALELDPELAEAHASLGSVLVRTGEHQAAETALRRAIELDPGYAAAHHWLGHLLTRRLHRLREGIAELEAARRLEPASSAILAMLGGAYYRAGRHAEALEVELALRELDPSWDSGDCITRNYIALRRYREAAAAVEAVSPEQRSLACWLGLTEALHLAGDYRAELTAARRGGELHPGAPGLLVAEAAALAALARGGEAADRIAAELDRDPRSAAWYGLYAVLGELRRHGSADESRRLAEAVVERHGRLAATSAPSLAAATGLTAALLESGRRAEGAVLLTAVLRSMEPEARRRIGLDDYHAIGLLGWLAALAGDHAEGQRALGRLQAYEPPANADPYTALIRAALGDPEGAVRALRERLAGGLAVGRDLHVHLGLEPLRDEIAYRDLAAEWGLPGAPSGPPPAAGPAVARAVR